MSDAKSLCRTLLLALVASTVLLVAAAPDAGADSACKPAAPLAQSKCTKDTQCCAGLVCEARHCQAGCHIGGAFQTSGQKSDWKAGSSWKLSFADGRVADAGEIVEADRPRRLVIRWRNEWKQELKAEGYSRCTFELEPVVEAGGDVVKLSITHEMDRPGSKLIEAVSGGWPRVLSNLKSLLETGHVVLVQAGHH